MNGLVVVAGVVISITAAGVVIKASEGATGRIRVEDDRAAPDLEIIVPEFDWDFPNIDIAVTAPVDTKPVAGSKSLNGTYVIGPVEGVWVNGRPTRFTHVDNRANTAVVPAALWAEIIKYWPREAQFHSVYVSFLESGFREGVPSSFNATGNEDSWGAFQVNRRAWNYSVAYLTTYAGNVKVGAHIFKIQGWRAWLNASRMLGLV